jgi:hypothetical protein
MDRKQLNIEIQKFIDRCNELQKPVLAFCLNEAYPGDSNTSYFFDLKAEWIKVNHRFDAISFFTDVMFEVMSIEARKKVFSIRVYKKDDELQCESGEVTWVNRQAS